MKKFLITLLLISFILIFPQKFSLSFNTNLTFFLQSEDFVFNGSTQKFSEKPIIKEGRSFVPLRDLSRVYEFSLSWNQKERGVEFFVGEKRIKLFSQKDFCLVEEKKISLLSKPLIYKNLFYVGIRDFANLLNLNVEWDSKNRSITLKGNFYPRLEVVDDLGFREVFTSPPKRVISLAPSNTELLFALGLDREIIGVTDFCDYPEKAKSKEKIGGFSNPNLERIFSLKPDFVFGIRGNPKDTLINLHKLNIKVLAFDPKDLDDFFKLVLMIGKIVDKREEAEDLVKRLSERRENLIKKAKMLPKKRVYLEIWNNPFMSVGENTYLNKIIEEVGGINIAKKASGDWPILSQEFIIQENPEVIIIAYHGNKIDDILKRPGWENIDAVKNGKIFFIDPDTIFRLGPRIMDGMESLFNYIHSTSMQQRGLTPLLHVGRN